MSAEVTHGYKGLVPVLRTHESLGLHCLDQMAQDFPGFEQVPGGFCVARLVSSRLKLSWHACEMS